MKFRDQNKADDYIKKRINRNNFIFNNKNNNYYSNNFSSNISNN